MKAFFIFVVLLALTLWSAIAVVNRFDVPNSQEFKTGMILGAGVFAVGTLLGRGLAHAAIKLAEMF